MDHFHIIDGSAHCESVPLTNLAEAVGTPAYVYSRATLRRHCREFLDAFRDYPTLPCYAVKANHNTHIIRAIAGTGFGADIVSGGELHRAIKAGVNPAKIVFSGVGKQADEIAAALGAGILAFNVESAAELDEIAAVAGARGVVAPVALRLNPDIDAKTNEKIATGLYSTKFGIAESDLMPLAQRIAGDRRLRLCGIACHIGSQIVELGPLTQAAARIAALAGSLTASGHQLSFINMGGGLGIHYRDESPPTLASYARALLSAIKPTGLRLVLEPGRVIVGNAGVILTRVIRTKRTPAKAFVIVDAAMTELIRPSLYDAWHRIEPVVAAGEAADPVRCDIVGPVCETGDYLGKDRLMALPAAGELLLIRGCGAYAAAMSSQYNSRPRAPEILVDGAAWHVIRRRETEADLLACERDEAVAFTS